MESVACDFDGAQNGCYSTSMDVDKVFLLFSIDFHGLCKSECELMRLLARSQIIIFCFWLELNIICCTRHVTDILWV